jgi:hypothetical protein
VRGGGCAQFDEMAKRQGVAGDDDHLGDRLFMLEGSTQPTRRGRAKPFHVRP